VRGSRVAKRASAAWIVFISGPATPPSPARPMSHGFHLSCAGNVVLRGRVRIRRLGLTARFVISAPEGARPARPLAISHRAAAIISIATH
jgi:hypothetical protein